MDFEVKDKCWRQAVLCVLSLISVEAGLND